MADALQFNRIINNLIQNALKYSKSFFYIKQYSLDNKCVLEFKNDTDIVTKEKIPYIFERFYTGDNSRNNKSTGLGLAIAKLLVEKMQGKIEAELVKVFLQYGWSLIN